MPQGKPMVACSRPLFVHPYPDDRLDTRWPSPRPFRKKADGTPEPAVADRCAWQLSIDGG